MGKAKRVRPTKPCVCGCGTPTKGTWAPGHDGRATGWALRVERGILTLEQVPDNERAGAELMLARRGVAVTHVETKAERRARRRAEKLASNPVEQMPEQQVA